MPAESQSALNTAAAHKTAVAALSAALLKPSTRLGAIETLYYAEKAATRRATAAETRNAFHMGDRRAKL